MRLFYTERERIISNARRETIDDLLVLHLAGTPYEMGFQQGALCIDEIRAFRREAYAYMGNLIAKALHLPQALAHLVTRPLLLRQVRAYKPFTPHEYLEEMYGVADGARVHVLEALLVNAVWEMYIVGGCSEFAARSSKTGDGELLHGYNYDLADPAHAFINPYLALIFSRPKDGYPFAQVNTVGCVGVNAGLSARGISVAWDNTYLRPQSKLLEGVRKFCTPFEIALRHLLQRSDSIEEAVEIMRSSLPRPTSDIIIIGDGKTRRAVALETAGNAWAMREMEQDAIWSANSFVSPTLGPEDRRGIPSADLSETGGRLGRYASYTELIAHSNQKIDVGRAVEILRDPYPREKKGYIYPDNRQRTICRPVTSFSLVMQPGVGRIWVGDPHIPAPQGRYLGFDMNSELPVSESPIQPTGFQLAMQSHEHFSANRYPKAMECAQKALEIDGESVPLRLMLAQLYCATGQEAEAQHEIAQVLAMGVSPGTKIPFPSAIKPLSYLTVE